MDFFKDHKQLFLNITFGVVLFALLGIGVYAQAEPAEEFHEAVEEKPDVAEATGEVNVSENADLNDREQKAYVNCCALQNLEIVDWQDDNGVISPESLQTVATNEDGIALILRLQNRDQDVVTYKNELAEENALNSKNKSVEENTLNSNYSAEKNSCTAYAIEENLVVSSCDGAADLQGDFYAELLVNTLNNKGFSVEKTDFSQYLNQTLTYEMLGDMTYEALQYTKEENGETVSFSDILLEENVITEDNAVIADLPVAENTEQTYEELFIKSLEEDSQPFVYTEKNKKLMLDLMNDKTSYFALINQNHCLEEDYVPQLTGSGNTQMVPKAYENLQIMLEDAKAAGLTLNMKSGYRSYQRQIQLYGKGENEYRSAPGTSEHQSGLAMDVVNSANALNESLSDSKEALWLAENCWKYGFIIRYTEEKEDITGYPAEWWHVRYVGKTIAYELHYTGMSYEEFYWECGGEKSQNPDALSVNSGEPVSAEKPLTESDPIN
jgi:D-alanyl-D-alanine carboxypeptidase